MPHIETPSRLAPEVERKILDCNWSSRNGTSPDTIVIHTTQGASWPYNWFNNPVAQASSHVSVLGGSSQRYVADPDKAWTQGNWNPRCLSIEIVGFAEWTTAKWFAEEPTLKEAARWVAHWSIQFDIAPIVRRAPDGVCGHVDISGPGGHFDPGKGFPWDEFIDLSRRIKQKRLG